MKIKPEWIKNFNGIAIIIWILLIIPTLTIFRESVPWLNFMSIYAIIVAHLSAWVASRVEVNEEK